MANSRLEKIGSIYTRTKGLIKSGALKWEDRPLWFDIYEAFPPKDEPRFDRPAPKIPLKQIFYEEDKIRALFHKRNKLIGTTNMFSPTSKTLTQRFIDIYNKLEKEYGGVTSPDKLYEETIEILQKDREKRSEQENEQVSLTRSFKSAQDNKTKTEQNLNIKVNELFKE